MSFNSKQYKWLPGVCILKPTFYLLLLSCTVLHVAYKSNGKGQEMLLIHNFDSISLPVHVSLNLHTQVFHYKSHMLTPLECDISHAQLLQSVGLLLWSMQVCSSHM